VKGRVHWDEKAIEEHNKERGTRQKIDEPDTPFVRSPQAASDSEGGPASSDDDHRLSFRSSPMGPLAPTQLPEQGGQQPDMDPLALASRLDEYVRSGVPRASAASSSAASSEYAADIDGADAGDNEFSRLSSACSSRSSSNAPAGRRPAADASVLMQRTRPSRGSREDRRISLSEDSIKPSKPSSAHFKAKRAQHYNEVAALRAFRSGDVSSPESGTSEEDDPTTTNTNTNINQTYAGPVEARLWRDKGDAQATVESGAASAEGSAACRDRAAVSFSGESGGESSEEFRSRRNSHSSFEWRHDPSVPITVSTLETNTNTNLNAGCSTSSTSSHTERVSDAKNPMEAARPPVQFGQDSIETLAPSEEFRARRQEHYDEARALRRFREELGGEDSLTSDEEARHENRRPSASQVDNLANPMEPRATGVAFKVSIGIGDLGADGGSGPHEVHSDPSAAADATVWKARRQAHYSEMAAALRSMPPPSDEEEESSITSAV